MSDFICRVCRSVFDDDKAICPKCGASPKCGARLSVGMNLDALTKSKLKIYRLEEENKKLKKELSILCPIADLSVIESLKSEKQLMMEHIAEQQKEIKKLDESLNIARIGRRDLTNYVKYLKEAIENAHTELCVGNWDSREKAIDILGKELS